MKVIVSVRSSLTVFTFKIGTSLWRVNVEKGLCPFYNLRTKYRANVLAFLAYWMRFSCQCLANTEVRCGHPSVGIGVWVYRALSRSGQCLPNTSRMHIPDFSSVGDQFSRNFSNAPQVRCALMYIKSMSANAQSDTNQEHFALAFGWGITGNLVATGGKYAEQ